MVLKDNIIEIAIPNLILEKLGLKNFPECSDDKPIKIKYSDILDKLKNSGNTVVWFPVSLDYLVDSSLALCVYFRNLASLKSDGIIMSHNGDYFSSEYAEKLLDNGSKSRGGHQLIHKHMYTSFGDVHIDNISFMPNPVDFLYRDWYYSATYVGAVFVELPISDIIIVDNITEYVPSPTCDFQQIVANILSGIKNKEKHEYL